MPGTPHRSVRARFRPTSDAGRCWLSCHDSWLNPASAGWLNPEPAPTADDKNARSTLRCRQKFTDLSWIFSSIVSPLVLLERSSARNGQQWATLKLIRYQAANVRVVRCHLGSPEKAALRSTHFCPHCIRVRPAVIDGQPCTRGSDAAACALVVCGCDTRNRFSRLPIECTKPFSALGDL